jgi:hypothetical protein
MSTEPQPVKTEETTTAGGYEWSAAMGKAVEHLVAASCIVATNARLNVSTAFVDDEGVDLVFHLRGGTATLAVQVKHTTTETEKGKRGQLICEVRSETFRPRPGLWMLFVMVDRPNAAILDVFFMSSVDFEHRANPAGKGKRRKQRITASVKAGSNDKWQAFRLPFTGLPERIIDILKSMEAAAGPEAATVGEGNG